jgi:tetratricopeptide (TPR) repeat protein
MNANFNRSASRGHNMSTPIIANLEKLLDGPRDGALLRYSLGNAWLALDANRAAAYYRDSVERDEHYSAAWKGLGKALHDAGRLQESLDAWQRGITVAEAKGDIQAAKEMKVFVRRLEKTLAPPHDAERGS